MKSFGLGVLTASIVWMGFLIWFDYRCETNLADYIKFYENLNKPSFTTFMGYFDITTLM